VSGSSHPGVTGGHTAEGSIFSACPNSRGSTTRNTISLDQLMAKHLGHETRFPSLVLNTNSQSEPVLHRERLDDPGGKQRDAALHAAVCE
jgi:hypothetical protein